VLLSLTSNAGEIAGTYPGQDTRGPATPFAAVQDAARSSWEQAASDFLRGAGIELYAGSGGVRVVDRYKSDAATPPVPFWGDPASSGAWWKSPVVLIGAGVVAFMLLKKR
jgi:hypothetical protein